MYQSSSNRMLFLTVCSTYRSVDANIRNKRLRFIFTSSLLILNNLILKFWAAQHMSMYIVLWICKSSFTKKLINHFVFKEKLSALVSPLIYISWSNILAKICMTPNGMFWFGMDCPCQTFFVLNNLQTYKESSCHTKSLFLFVFSHFFSRCQSQVSRWPIIQQKHVWTHRVPQNKCPTRPKSLQECPSSRPHRSFNLMTH